MGACCGSCEHIRTLKHNFKQGAGFEESFCCAVFANQKDGFVLEVDKDDMCEMFTERGQGQ